ncbi:MAG: hypothetical protein ACJ71H_18680 [Nitrososphaeraceae archaeon]
MFVTGLTVIPSGLLFTSIPSLPTDRDDITSELLPKAMPFVICRAAKYIKTNVNTWQHKLGKIYDVDVEVQLVTHMTHMTHVGLDKHLQEQPEGKESVDSQHENTNISNKKPEDKEKITSQDDRKDGQSSIDVSQASHVSPIATAEQFQCYYCDSFKTNSNDDYEGHTVMKPRSSMLFLKSRLRKAWTKSTGKELGNITMA